MQTHPHPRREYGPSTPSRPLLPAKPPKSRAMLRDYLVPPAKTGAALGDAIAWIITAALLRVIIDLWLSTSTSFWLPGMFILIAPAFCAVSLATLVPQLSVILGYRLLLIMIGFLLGGKL